MKYHKLGKTDVQVPAIGVGTMLWLPTNDQEKENYFEVYKTCLDYGINFFDTAEIYGNGKSERLLGEFLKRDGRKILISSKFAPPSKMNPLTQKRKQVDKSSPKALEEALNGSLERLGVSCIDLYLIHVPPKKGNISDYMEIMAKAVHENKIKAIGVCNFSAKQIEEAEQTLEKYGLSLAVAMVGYNILRRYPETNGVFDVCGKYGISIIPYAPLAEGTLTGKYRNEKVPFMYKMTSYFGHLNITKERNDHIPFIKRLLSCPRECDTKKMEPLMIELDKIAQEHNKTIAQVSINWLLTNPNVDVIPIPGMRNVKQVKDNVGAIDWELSKEEREIINNIEEKTR